MPRREAASATLDGCGGRPLRSGAAARVRHPSRQGGHHTAPPLRVCGSRCGGRSDGSASARRSAKTIRNVCGGTTRGAGRFVDPREYRDTRVSDLRRTVAEAPLGTSSTLGRYCSKRIAWRVVGRDMPISPIAGPPAPAPCGVTVVLGEPCPVTPYSICGPKAHRCFSVRTSRCFPTIAGVAVTSSPSSLRARTSGFSPALKTTIVPASLAA
jgi:hypothetical protein